jgi:hypothetical protein
MGTPTASSATELIEWGSANGQVLDPAQLANLEVEITPTLAALSFLSSRRAFWETHALVVGFAMDMVGEADPDRVMAVLSNKEYIGQWFDDQVFRGYVDEQYVQTEPAGLVMSALVIDNALARDALRSAQFGTARVHYCQGLCRGEPQCMLRCLTESSNV